MVNPASWCHCSSGAPCGGPGDRDVCSGVPTACSVAPGTHQAPPLVAFVTGGRSEQDGKELPAPRTEQSPGHTQAAASFPPLGRATSRWCLQGQSCARDWKNPPNCCSQASSPPPIPASVTQPCTQHRRALAPCTGDSHVVRPPLLPDTSSSQRGTVPPGPEGCQSRVPANQG